MHAMSILMSHGYPSGEAGSTGSLAELATSHGNCGEMADRCEIAQPSIFAKSGRGLYVFWLLRDEENPTNRPQLFNWISTSESMQKYRSGLRCVAPDHAAKDGARVLRVPNTKHPNAVTVQYLKQQDENGKVPDYTLKEMAEWFGVEPVQKQRRRFNPEQVKGNRSGYKAVHQKRKRDLERLFRAGGVRQETGDSLSPSTHTHCECWKPHRGRQRI